MYSRDNLEPMYCCKVVETQIGYDMLKNQMKRMVNDFFLESVIPIYEIMSKTVPTWEDVLVELELLVNAFKYAPFYMNVDYFNSASEFRGNEKYEEFDDDERFVLSLNMNETIQRLYKTDISAVDSSCDSYTFFYLLIYKEHDGYKLAPYFDLFNWDAHVRDKYIFRSLKQPCTSYDEFLKDKVNKYFININE